jgi:hypothetical protein
MSNPTSGRLAPLRMASAGPEESSDSFTDAGVILGSPAYLAPTLRGGWSTRGRTSTAGRSPFEALTDGSLPGPDRRAHHPRCRPRSLHVCGTWPPSCPGTWRRCSNLPCPGSRPALSQRAALRDDPCSGADGEPVRARRTRISPPWGTGTAAPLDHAAPPWPWPPSAPRLFWEAGQPPRVA